MEVARCLTGWTILAKKDDGFSGKLLSPFKDRGKVVFRKEAHDDGAKRVLGHEIPAGGGENDLDRVIDIVAAHPEHRAVHRNETLRALHRRRTAGHRGGCASQALSPRAKATSRRCCARSSPRRIPRLRRDRNSSVRSISSSPLCARRMPETNAEQALISYLERMGHVAVSLSDAGRLSRGSIALARHAALALEIRARAWRQRAQGRRASNPSSCAKFSAAKTP